MPRSLSAPRLCLLAVLVGLLKVTCGCSEDIGSAGVPGPSPHTVAKPVAGDEPAARSGKAEALALTLFSFQCIERLQKPAVRNSLALTKDQEARIAHLVAAIDAIRADPSAPDDPEAAKRYDDLGNRVHVELREVLSADQFQTVRTLVIRDQIGSTAFLMPGVARTINLTEDQIATICGMLEEHIDELQPRNFSVWNIRKVISLGRQLRARAEELLDEEQHARWQGVLDGSEPIVD